MSEKLRAELDACRRKISSQRKSLKQLGQAHELVWYRLKDSYEKETSLRKSYHESLDYNSRLSSELRRAKGWGLREYFGWLRGKT